MKFFIWFFGYFFIAIANLIFGYVSGVRMGSVLLFFVWAFSARALCKKWDSYKIARKMARENYTSAFETIKNDVSSEIIKDCEQMRGNGTQLKKYLKQCIKKGEIFEAEADIVYSHFMVGTRFLNNNIQQVEKSHDDEYTTKQPETTVPVSRGSVDSLLKIANISNIILSIVAMIVLLIAVNVQDINRDIMENISPSIIYSIAIVAFLVVCCMNVYSFEIKSINATIWSTSVVFCLSMIAFIEGAVYSKSAIVVKNGVEEYVRYGNREQVDICNSIWLITVVVMLILSVLPLFSHVFDKSTFKWHSSIKYREKCYKRVAELQSYLEKGIITQEEFEKTKQDILKNIKI